METSFLRGFYPAFRRFVAMQFCDNSWFWELSFRIEKLSSEVPSAVRACPRLLLLSLFMLDGVIPFVLDQFKYL